MNETDLINLRLFNNGLSSFRFKTATQVVSHFGAFQAQDFPMATWGLGLRVKDSTVQSIEREFNEGTILRTHVMRPTWHFVLPEDIRWMLELTSPRVKAAMRPTNRRIGLDDDVLKRSNKVLVKALQERKYLNRQELKTILEDAGISTDVQRLAHIIAWAELDGLICSGPKKGKQFTYALLEDRAPTSKELPREETLAGLT
jgi:hypothetical protein